MLGSCSGHSGDTHDHGHEADKSEKTEKDHEGLIVLSDEQLKQLKISTEEITASDFSDVMKVSGEITSRPGSDGIASARQSGIVHLTPGIAVGSQVAIGRVIASISAKGMAGGDPNEAARLAYNAAKREVDRLTPLHKEGIVTTRDYNEALARLDQAKAAMGNDNAGGGSVASAPVSGVITSISVVDGQFVEAGQPIATISSNSALSLRADLPENVAGFLPTITGARFRPSYSDEIVDLQSVDGKLLSPPTVSSAANGYIPVYFTLPNAGGNYISGSYCEVYLLGNTRSGVLSVPETSLSEQQGEYFVYREEMPGHFRKIPVTIGRSDGSRREILSGISAGDRIVARGTTFVRLAESSGAVPEGHSHSH